MGSGGGGYGSLVPSDGAVGGAGVACGTVGGTAVAVLVGGSGDAVTMTIPGVRVGVGVGAFDLQPASDNANINRASTKPIRYALSGHW